LHQPLAGVLLIRSSAACCCSLHRASSPLSTYNLEIGITASCVAAVDTEGSICLPAQMLREIIDRSDDGDAISHRAQTAHSSPLAAPTHLPPQPAEDFPDLPAITAKGQQLDLGAAAKAAVAIASTDGAKAILTGVRVADRHVCATDGHRMLRWPLQGRRRRCCDTSGGYGEADR
jgi:DNA polymerase III sliding clamp (beta) subunit (PCNA family)